MPETFGNTTKGQLVSVGISNVIWGGKFLCSTLGTLQSITGFVNLYAGNYEEVPIHYKFALYDAAGNFIAQTEEGFVPWGILFSDWSTLTFASPPIVVPNTYYTLVAWSSMFDGDDSSVLFGSATTGGVNFRKAWYEANFPTTIGVHALPNLLSIYATVMPNPSLLTETAVAAQKVVAVVSGALFAPLQTVKIEDAAANENNVVDSVSGNNLTMLNNLAHTYMVAGIASVKRIYDGTISDWAPGSEVEIYDHYALPNPQYYWNYHVHACLNRKVVCYIRVNGDWVYHGETGWQWIKTKHLSYTGWGRFSNNDKIIAEFTGDDADWLQGSYPGMSNGDPNFETRGLAFVIEYRVDWYTVDLLDNNVQLISGGVSYGTQWSYDDSINWRQETTYNTNQGMNAWTSPDTDVLVTIHAEDSLDPYLRDWNIQLALESLPLVATENHYSGDIWHVYLPPGRPECPFYYYFTVGQNGGQQYGTYSGTINGNAFLGVYVSHSAGPFLP